MRACAWREDKHETDRHDVQGFFLTTGPCSVAAASMAFFAALDSLSSFTTSSPSSRSSACSTLDLHHVVRSCRGEPALRMLSNAPRQTSWCQITARRRETIRALGPRFNAGKRVFGVPSPQKGPKWPKGGEKICCTTRHDHQHTRMKTGID